MLNWSWAVTVKLKALPAVALEGALTPKCVAAAAWTVMTLLVPVMELLLVSVAVLVVLVLLVSRLFSSAAAVTTSGNKRMDAEAQTRPLFERVAVDFDVVAKCAA